jgi:hypothetical protein
MAKRMDISKGAGWVLLALMFITAAKSQLSACAMVERVVNASQKFSIHVVHGKIPISGAQIEIAPELTYEGKTARLGTDTNGIISGELKPGRYSIWVRYAGLSDYLVLDVSETPTGIDPTIQWVDSAKSIRRLSGMVTYSEKSERIAVSTMVTVTDAITGKQVTVVRADKDGVFDAGVLPTGVYAVSFDFRSNPPLGLTAVEPVEISEQVKPRRLRISLSDSDCGPIASIENED